MRQADSASPAEGLKDRRSARAGFRPDIEGLRAVAVLAVVLFHAQIPGFDGGFVGVDVFFVISGFLITGLLWREAKTTGTMRLGNFYGARARRLLPASALVGVFIMVCAAVLVPPLQARKVIVDGIASALYVSNYRFALDGVNYLASLSAPSPFQHYWSLGVEEQFYLVWAPLFLGTAWLIRRARRTATGPARSSQRPFVIALAVVAAVSLALSIAITYVAPPLAFFSLPTRAWQLALGGLVALTADHWRQLPPRAAAVTGWTGLALILLACVQFSPTTLYPGTAALLPTAGTVLVIGAGCTTATQGCGRLLSVAPMQAIGRISYSLYLWHWPILLLALWSIAPVTGHGLWLGLGGILLSVALAALTLRFVENPLRYSPKIRNSPSRSLALGGAVTAIAVCVGFALHAPAPVGHGAPATPLTVIAAPVPASAGMAAHDAAVAHAFAQVQAAVSASANLKAVPSNLEPSLANAAPGKSDGNPAGCVLGFFDVAQPECAVGDTSSATTVALVGDSNAAMLIPSFQQAAEQRHWRLETLTKVGCPFLGLPVRNPVASREYTECQQWRAQTVTRLRAEHPKLVVLSMMRRYGAAHGWAAGFTSYDSAWLDSLTRLMAELRATGAQVLLLGPIPDPGSVVPDCLSEHLDDATACSPPRASAVNHVGIAAETAATNAGAGQYADLTELFCTRERCPVIIGNSLVYFDENHLTSNYAKVLGPVMGTLADRALAHR